MLGRYGAILFLCLLLPAGSGFSAEETPRFAQADPRRVLQFPRDHGKHSDFQTEWWYFTGNLTSPDKNFGFQLTFFRRSLLPERPKLDSDWTARDLYPAHFALTDKTDKRFYHFDIIAREGPNLAGAAADDLDVHVRNWRVKRDQERLMLEAQQNGAAINLTLTPLKPIVLHGKNGYSRKGDDEHQASHYYSFTRLAAQGTVRLLGKEYAVEGLAWMDHEFGSSILSKDQAGWDWFSLQLDDGTDLMVFHLRKKDGAFETPFGTLVAPDGVATYLRGDDIAILPQGQWRSPATNALYPAGWQISVKKTDTVLSVAPAVPDQELSAGRSTQVIYWEGAVNVSGRHQGRPVAGAAMRNSPAMRTPWEEGSEQRFQLPSEPQNIHRISIDTVPH